MTDQKGLAFSTSSVTAEFHKPLLLATSDRQSTGLRVKVLRWLKYDGERAIRQQQIPAYTQLRKSTQ